MTDNDTRLILALISFCAAWFYIGFRVGQIVGVKHCERVVKKYLK